MCTQHTLIFCLETLTGLFWGAFTFVSILLNLNIRATSVASRLYLGAKWGLENFPILHVNKQCSQCLSLYSIWEIKCGHRILILAVVAMDYAQLNLKALHLGATFNQILSTLVLLVLPLTHPIHSTSECVCELLF